MKKYLLPPEGRFFKANLHCHSTVSDGRLSPEALRDAYRAHGYSVLAITDHEIMMDHSDLSTDDFLMINGYEAYVKENMDDGRYMRTCHLNFIARRPDLKEMVYVDPDYVKYSQKNGFRPEELPRVGELVKRRYNARSINRLMAEAVKAGYLVAYNHPSWSLETVQEYGFYEGMYAMEVYNHGTCVDAGFPGDDARDYDRMLHLGRKIYALANDDNHNKVPLDDPSSDSFGGFNMIKAEKLSYESIIQALERGDFYASQGPEILDLYVEDGKVHLTCGERVKQAFLKCDARSKRQGRSCHAGVVGEGYLTDVTFDLLEEDQYFRMEVWDENGRKAFTRAYFMEDLGI